jgi:hypothetical protein
MTMPSRLRKLVLTLHVTCSVGWLGAVVAFLALAVAGLTSDDAQRIRGCYLAMESIAWVVIVPLSLASLVTGLVQSLGTTWGLFRHYWIVAKFVLNVLATLLLLVHMQPIGRMAAAAASASFSPSELVGLRVQLIADAAAAVVVLLAAVTLSVFKPRGLTRYGRRLARGVALLTSAAK